MVAKNLKQLRWASGMSRAHLGLAVGVSIRTLEGHEQGRPMNLVTFTAYKRLLPDLEVVHNGY